MSPSALPCDSVDEDLIGFLPDVGSLSPEQNLWVACLERAILDLIGGYTTLREKVKTTQWFWSDKKRLGSYLWICESLSIDAPTIIKRLIAFKVIPPSKESISRDWFKARNSPAMPISIKTYRRGRGWA